MVERRATVKDSQDLSGGESDEAFQSDLEHEIGGLGTTRQLAEYRARTLGDEDTAHKIREGQYTESELIAMLEKENDELADYLQGHMTDMSVYADDDGRHETLSLKALSGRYNDE